MTFSHGKPPIAVALSLTFHFLVLGVFFLFGKTVSKSQHVDPIWIELTEVQEKVPHATEKKQDIEKRIVETALSEPTQSAPEKAYLGKQNQKVEKELMSTSKKTSSESQKISKGQGINTRTAPTSLAKFGLQVLPKQGAPSSEKGTVASEYIKGLKEGEQSALNTKEFIFFGYFQRIRERLDLAWSSQLKRQIEKIYKEGRQIASEQEHKTRTLVTLNNQGEVVRVQIVEESGVKDLDETAVRAFNKAGPFPNPPRGLVDARGEIQIQWEFLLRT